MFQIELHETINRILKLFYRFGIWHKGDEPTIRESRIKWFYSFFYLLFPISLLSGAIKCDNREDRVFMIEAFVLSLVFTLKMIFLIWKQKDIIEMLQNVCVYSIAEQKDFNLVNDKLKKFMKFVYFFIFAVVIAHVYVDLIVPIFASDNQLFFKIGFPLDWKNDRIAFWIANIFIISETILTEFAILFSILIWYCLLHCVLRYEILGNEIQNMGAIKAIETPANHFVDMDMDMDSAVNKRKISDVEKQNIYLRDLTAAVDSHAHIRGVINKLISFLAIIFFTEMITSGLCICGSIYCLVYDAGENFGDSVFHVITLFYHLSEIFMIMYFGNEIMCKSDKLLYCLFESNWVDQPQSTKKLILIFGELLQKSHVLVVGYIYPLTLETFRRIVNSAYNMFNILKNLK